MKLFLYMGRFILHEMKNNLLIFLFYLTCFPPCTLSLLNNLYRRFVSVGKIATDNFQHK